jgi:putative DNA primase/helicase
MGPCPLCGGKTRFRWDNKDGTGSYYCNKCGPGYGLHLAMAITGKDFKTVVSEIDRMDGLTQEEVKPQVDPRIRLRKIAENCKQDDGVIAAYLASRGIRLPVPAALKIHKNMKYFDDVKPAGEYHAMCSLFSDAQGKPASYHVTYLLGDDKAPVESPKKLMKPTTEIKGGAIRLTNGVPSYLGVAEGIETALAVTQLYDIPCWATYSASMLEAFEVPDGVERLGIFADHDKNYTGQKAAYALANKVAIKYPDIRVHVMIPGLPGEDFNDVLMRGGAA